jgi:putative NIF3 family GTP cyclohydrolase 1 type 2
MMMGLLSSPHTHTIPDARASISRSKTRQVDRAIRKAPALDLPDKLNSLKAQKSKKDFLKMARPSGSGTSLTEHFEKQRVSTVLTYEVNCSDHDDAKQDEPINLTF